MATMPTPENRPQLLVRPALEIDAAAMREIFNEGVQDHLIPFEEHPRSIEVQKDLITAAMADPMHPILVAELRGWVLGWIALTPYDSRPSLADVAEVSVSVRRSFRNYGVGRQLMQAIQGEAARLNYRKLIGRLLAENGDSLRLCVSCGWREVGRHIKHDASFEELRDIVVVEYLVPTWKRSVE
jgi:L-amino acid N-acyltransferase YncA